MEATTIDQLFPDVLEEIFSHLNGSDLMNCALVCKDWDDVIGSYATTMKKLKIGFRLDREEISIGCDRHEGIKIQSTDEGYRKYRNVETLIRDGSLTQLPSLDRFNISQVRSLDLRFMLSASIEPNMVVELLSRMPLLRVMKIYFQGEFTLDSSNAPAAHLPKLKQLNVHSKSDQPINTIFDFIKADNLTELTYHTYRDMHSEAEIDVLVDFIKGKKSLAKFTVSSNAIAELLRRHDFSGMNLESLHLIGFSSELHRSDIVLENFRKSLISTAHSLSSLSIPSWLMSREVCVIIFNRLRKLTTLEIGSHDDYSWMDNLSPIHNSHNSSLKTLRVNQVGAIDGLKAILQRSPLLKKLSLGRVTDAIMNEVATSASRLVELRIETLEEILSGEERFNELKSLTIAKIDHVEILASLLERCPKIEVFQYSFYVYPSAYTNDLIDILLQQKTLKHLKFNCWSAERSRIIFDKLKTNFGSLRSLELGYHFKFILFEFPENPAEWKVARQEARFFKFQEAHST